MPEAIARLDALFTFPKLAEGMEFSPDHRTELLRVVGVAIDFLKANIGPGAYERFSYLLEILDDLILTYDLKIDIEWTNQISDMKVESVRSHLSSLLHHVAGRPGFYWKRTDLLNALTALKASGASVETYMAYERFVQEQDRAFFIEYLRGVQEMAQADAINSVHDPNSKPYYPQEILRLYSWEAERRGIHPDEINKQS